MTTLHRHSLATSIIALLLGAGVLLPGCHGETASGTRYVFKPNRELEGQVPASLSTVHQAARGVLENDYLYIIEQDALDARTGVLEARTADDDVVKVRTSHQGQDLTEVEVFITPFGSEDRQAEIFDAIYRRVVGG